MLNTSASSPLASSTALSFNAATGVINNTTSTTSLIASPTNAVAPGASSPSHRLAEEDEDEDDEEEEEDDGGRVTVERSGTESPLKPFVVPSDNLSSLESLGASTFDYLYEFSETRKVLEEFFKCPAPTVTADDKDGNDPFPFQVYSHPCLTESLFGNVRYDL